MGLVGDEVGHDSSGEGGFPDFLDGAGGFGLFDGCCPDSALEGLEDSFSGEGFGGGRFFGLPLPFSGAVHRAFFEPAPVFSGEDEGFSVLGSGGGVEGDFYEVIKNAFFLRPADEADFVGFPIHLDALPGALVEASVLGADHVIPIPEEVAVAVAGEDEFDVVGAEDQAEFVFVVNHDAVAAGPVVGGDDDGGFFADFVEFGFEPCELGAGIVAPVREGDGAIEDDDGDAFVHAEAVGFAEAFFEDLNALGRPSDIVVSGGVEGGDFEFFDEGLVVVVFAGPTVVRDVAAVDGEGGGGAPGHLEHHLAAGFDVAVEGDVGVAEVEEFEGFGFREGDSGGGEGGGGGQEVAPGDAHAGELIQLLCELTWF